MDYDWVESNLYYSTPHSAAINVIKIGKMKELVQRSFSDFKAGPYVLYDSSNSNLKWPMSIALAIHQGT